MRQITSLFFILLFISSAQTATISTETFFKNPDLTSIRISPDGKHFAATTETDGVKKLVILDVDATKILQVFDFSSEYREIGSFGWLNNERIYASMVRKVGPLDQPAPTGYLFAGNINGKKTVQLLPAKSRTKGGNRDRQRPYSILSMLPDDDKHILISLLDDNRHTYAYKMNVYHGGMKTVRKSAEPFASLMSDHNGQVRVSTNFSDEGDEYFIHLWDEQQEQWALFKKFDDKAINIQPLGFSANNQRLFIENTTGAEGRGVYALDLTNQEVTLVHQIKGDASMESQIWDLNQSAPELIGFTRMPGYMEVEFFDPNHQVAKLYRSLFQSFKGQAINLVNASADGKQVVVSVWSDYNPGNHYLMDLNSNQVKPLFKTRPWIDRRQMANKTPISFTARDGLEIHGYLTRPLNAGEQAGPMVLLIHGGPYGVADRWGYESEVQFLAHHGYSVLQVNYRGSGGRGGAFQFDHYRQMGVEMQHDLTDATHWAIKEGFADANRICIYGASYGGYAALMGAAMEPDLYQCSIGYVGLYDIGLISQADTVQSESGRRFAAQAWDYKNDEFVKARSPLTHASKIKAPVMLVHGGKDPRVTVANFHRMKDALTQAGNPPVTLLKTYEGHGFFDLENKVELYDKLLAFLNQHMGQPVKQDAEPVTRP